MCISVLLTFFISNLLVVGHKLIDILVHPKLFIFGPKIAGSFFQIIVISKEYGSGSCKHSCISLLTIQYPSSSTERLSVDWKVKNQTFRNQISWISVSIVWMIIMLKVVVTKLNCFRNNHYSKFGGVIYLWYYLFGFI